MRAGVLYGIAAYGLWGLFPVSVRLLDEAGPVVVLALTRKLHAIRELAGDRRRLALLSGAAVLIAVNWGIYLYAVSVDRVIEAALGYFITPLVSVAFGMLVFGERLRGVQAAALGLGTAAVIVLTAYYGGFPWIALSLSASFGTYGLLKKLADVGAAEGLAVETLVLMLPALAYVAVLAWTGEGAFASGDLGTTLLLALAGPITAVPLLLFAACVTRVPLTTMGLLQYLTPVLQFLIGWLVLGEAMPLTRWVGFGLVWVALVLLTWDGLRAVRRSGVARREAALAVTEPT
jgi:chloramphenicol-sensitive protein RarD